MGDSPSFLDNLLLLLFRFGRVLRPSTPYRKSTATAHANNYRNWPLPVLCRGGDLGIGFFGKTKWRHTDKSFTTLNIFPMAKNVKKSNDRELFDAFFPGLVDDVVKENENDPETGNAVRHMREVRIRERT